MQTHRARARVCQSAHTIKSKFLLDLVISVSAFCAIYLVAKYTLQMPFQYILVSRAKWL